MFNAGEIYSKLQAVPQPCELELVKGTGLSACCSVLPSGPELSGAYFPNKTHLALPLPPTSEATV